MTKLMGSMLLGLPSTVGLLGRKPLYLPNFTVPRCEVSSLKVARRGLKKATPLTIEEGKADMDKSTARKRAILEPKQVALRQSGVHGNTFISYVQILGTGMDTRDTSASVLLFFDKRRIIFNAGEGLQRFCIEHKIKLSKLDHVFLTRVCSETASGVPGLLLTLANTGETGIAVNLWGPSDLNVLVDAMRTFIPNSSVVHAHSFSSTQRKELPTGSARAGESQMMSVKDTLMLLDDEVVKISAVLLEPGSSVPDNPSLGKSRMLQCSTEDEENKTKCEDFEILCSDVSSAKNNGSSLALAEPWELGFENVITSELSDQKRQRVGSSFCMKTQLVDHGSNSGIEPLPRLLKESPNLGEVTHGQHEVAVVYICELPEIIGKFDPEKAKALGLRPGPKYGQLQAGKSVHTDAGNRMVHPSDVMDPSSPGPICLVVDCPSISHVSSLISAAGLEKFYSKTSTGADRPSSKKATCVIHIGPATVVNCSPYREWMAKFEGTQHMMAGHGMVNSVPPILKASARVMSRLNFICPQVFPIVGLQQMEDMMNTNEDELTSMTSITTAENLLKFHLRPISATPLDRSFVPEPLDIPAVRADLIAENPELEEASKQLAEIWSANSRKIVNKLGAGNDDLQQGSLPATSGLLEDLPTILDAVGREEMEIVFLGTGSSQPSKYRNVSAVYIHLFKRGGLLLDCGEGTYAQLKRRYGNNAADEIVGGLKCVWISHIHADHHTGLARILSVRKKMLEHQGRLDPALVVGPKQLKRYLDAYGKLEDLGMEFLDCSQTTVNADWAATQILNGQDSVRGGNFAQSIRDAAGSTEGSASDVLKAPVGLIRPGKSLNVDGRSARGLRNYLEQSSGFNFQAGLDETGREKLKNTLSSLGLSTLTSVPVVHCAHAFGVVLVARGKKLLQPGWKLVYSGDTRPCRALVEASKGATVLIHEATFDDAMPEEAIAKNHSLTREAIETGVSAGAYRTILTHFSQRYPKIPVFNESYNDRTCIAFDMMSVNLADLPLLPKLLPALKLLFKDDMIVEEKVEDLVNQS